MLRHHGAVCALMVQLICGVAAQGCPAGSFIDADAACTECPPGSFSGDADASECSACPPGTFAPAGSSACASCPEDKADEDQDPATPCVRCAPGKFSGIDSGGCQPCAQGTQWSRDHQACAVCPAGYYRSDGTTTAKDWAERWHTIPPPNTTVAVTMIATRDTPDGAPPAASFGFNEWFVQVPLVEQVRSW